MQAFHLDIGARYYHPKQELSGLYAGVDSFVVY